MRRAAELKQRVGGKYGMLVGVEEYGTIIRESADKVLQGTFRRRVCERHNKCKMLQQVDNRRIGMEKNKRREFNRRKRRGSVVGMEENLRR